MKRRQHERLHGCDPLSQVADAASVTYNGG